MTRAPFSTRCLLIFAACALAAAAAIPAAAASAGVFHELTVELHPQDHRLRVTDALQLPGDWLTDPEARLPFTLHAGLAPTAGEGWRVEPAEGEGSAAGSSEVPLEHYVLVRTRQDARQPVLRYEGEIHHPIETLERDYQRGFSQTPGLIGPEGIFLAGGSAWIPDLAMPIEGFELRVTELPEGWGVVSQGGLTRETSADGAQVSAWRFPHPAEEVYLVAGPWHEYRDEHGDTELLAFLREPDPALASRYLEATGRYLTMYESMLPEYPYRSFALVENFWETGYGMPGFTLLGPRVIRFPWILTSSYPHELLHNWWGNSVYVADAGGNWCEGLTAYMADHLFAEQKGEAELYRRNTLKKFTDFVRDSRDFPLVEFTSRHSPASEAVGYGKALMLFHMARRAVGDQAFLEAMHAFAETFRFEPARFEDIAAELDRVDESDRSWTDWFHTWTHRPGAPRLEIAEATVEARAGGTSGTHALRLTLEQVQEAEPFPLEVPVAVTLAGAAEPVWQTLPMARSRLTTSLELPGRPVRVDVDPRFDVMRRLSPWEVPPALSTLFGAEAPAFVLAADAPEAEREAWRQLAADWAAPGEPRVLIDSETDRLPDGEVWLLGWDNRFAGEVLASLSEHGVTRADGALRVGDTALTVGADSAVLVARRDEAPERAMAWVAGPVGAVAGLARKLPHYTKYSYLGFRGDAPDNVLKGQWEPLRSPMARALTPAAREQAAPNWPERQPLASLPTAYDADRMVRAVRRLADPALEGRGLGSAGLETATGWVASRFREIGLEPAGDDGYRQTWSWTGGEPAREMTLTNLIGRLPGRDPALEGAPVIVMAHLDHLGRGWPDVRAGNEGRIHPGADDNASGVAVMLELARVLAEAPPAARPVLFAAVSGEEAGRVGSRKLLDSLAKAAPIACVNLDSVGRLTADGKLLVLNADSAREWRFVFMGVEHTTGVPISVVPEALDSSDQVSCLERGIPAVQLFTGAHENYHRPSDTAERIEPEGMVDVARAAGETVTYLADRTDPLDVRIEGFAGGAEDAEPAEGSAHGAQGHGGHGHGERSGSESRRVSLGTMPDFAYSGDGVRLQDVLDGSPAERAGVKPGDVLLAIDGEPVADLRTYSDLLKAHEAGDTITLELRRDGETVTLEATLTER
jgi:hypothetical protein